MTNCDGQPREGPEKVVTVVPYPRTGGGGRADTRNVIQGGSAGLPIISLLYVSDDPSHRPDYWGLPTQGFPSADRQATLERPNGFWEPPPLPPGGV